TGKILWTYDASVRGINTTPTIVGTTVFCGHAEENIFDTTVVGALFAIDGTGTGNVTKTKELWLKPTVMLGRAAPLFVNDRLYVIDDGALMSVRDPKSGNEIGKLKVGTGEVFSSPLYADGKIYCAVRSGITAILEPTEKGVKSLHKLRLEGDSIHGSPIASHGRIYLPSTDAMYCIGFKDQAPVA